MTRASEKRLTPALSPAADRDARRWFSSRRRAIYPIYRALSNARGGCARRRRIARAAVWGGGTLSDGARGGAALESAIRLLESPGISQNRGDFGDGGSRFS